jgi:two-component system nitrogen regulation response regulator NtrX
VRERRRCDSNDVAVEKLSAGIGKRILVVDDEQAVRDTLRVVLHFEGHTVVEAANGREACLIFTPGDFDLVITAAELCRTENPGDAILEKPFTLAALRQMIALH